MTEKEVGKIIRSLTSNKAPSPAKVSAKGLADSLLITIAEITNIVITSFSLSKFAQVWKLVDSWTRSHYLSFSVVSESSGC